MNDFNSYFSRESIIHELCRARIKLAKKRNDALFIHRISKDKPAAESKGGRMAIELDGIFPPRRVWCKFRPKKRKGRQDSQSISLIALERAVKLLMARDQEQDWVFKLKLKVKSIQDRIGLGVDFKFQKPNIIGVEKDPKLNTFRPLAVYPLEDKIIECLVAIYSWRRRISVPFLIVFAIELPGVN